MAERFQGRMLRRYDRDMRSELTSLYYGNSDFFNYGYWRPETATQREASENLMAELLAFIPEKTGTILDVACGVGGSTLNLLQHYQPSQITAINLSQSQLSKAEYNAPGCTFRVMDAAHLDFPDNSFDNLLCVEAAFHFDTREQFFREALRVLKPGGRLVLSDILHQPLPRWLTDQIGIPPANYVKDPPAYEALMRGAGFVEVKVVDTTRESRDGMANGLKRWPGQERKSGLLDFKTYLAACVGSLWYRAYLRIRARYYVIASGTKPA